MANILFHIGNEQQRHLGIACDGTQLGRHHGADRTRRRVRRRRGTTKAVQGGRRHWHIDGVTRSSPTATPTTCSRTTCTWCSPSPGRRTGNKGTEPVLGSEVPARPGNRRFWRAQRVRRHRPGTQDGAEGVGHLRAHLGEHGIPSVGWLVGDSHDGIVEMFKVIEYARMMVGTKAIATLSTGYLNALGVREDPDTGRRHDTDDRQDRTAGHDYPPPRRAPGAADAEVLRRRSSCALPVHRRTPGPVGGGDRLRGRPRARRTGQRPTPADRQGCGLRTGLPMPTESLQTLGGSGFLQDYPIEQYIRDAKIDSLYEGTTAIQAQDFFFARSPRPGGGAAARRRTDSEFPGQRYR